MANPELDYQDVFGGPPRRFAPRRCRADSLDLFSGRGKRSGFADGEAGYRRPSSGLGEKPVFGEVGSPARTRHLGDDFFDDIFQGSDSSSPKVDFDPFASAPGSRLMSPTIRGLAMPRSYPFGGGSSLPSQLSNSGKVTKGMDYLMSGSPFQQTLHKNDDGVSDSRGVSNFASPAVSTHEDQRMETHSHYRQSPLSRKFFYSLNSTSNDSGSASFSRESQLRKHETDSEGYSRSSRFHFSMYKWAGKGAMLIRPSNFKDRGNNGSSGRVLPELVLQGVDMPVDDDRMQTAIRTSESKSENRDGKSVNNLVKEKDADPVIKEDHLPSRLESEVLHSSTTEESDNKIECQQRVSGSPLATDTAGDVSKEVSSNEEKAPKVKSLHELFSGSSGISGQVEETEGMTKGGINAHERANANVQAIRERIASHNESSLSTECAQDTPNCMEDKMPGWRARGKVKEFIKIFSQDIPPKPKEMTGTKKQKPTKKDSRKQKVKKELDEHPSKTDEMKANSGNNQLFTDNHLTINQILKHAEEPYPKFGSDVDIISDFLPIKNDSFASESAAEMFGNPVGIVAEARDLEECLVEQLSQDHNEQLQSGAHQDQIEISDAKIREWSEGKEGNIRSLLSTLQYVLWPESGWKPVPLVDIIEGSSVKRAYQKALLCLHPDKLQQKGAAIHQKYIAEKVFDILKEAWDQFNSVSLF